MKLIDLLNKIANGEIKDGTKFKDKSSEYIIENGCINHANRPAVVEFNFISERTLNMEVEIIEEKQQGRWKPKVEGAAYFSINDWGVIFQTHYNNAPQDWFRILNKNVFKTDSEAKEYLEYKTALLEAEKPFVGGSWHISLKNGEVKAMCSVFQRNAGAIYLGTDETVAQAFIDKWHKQILKYEFGIEE